MHEDVSVSMYTCVCVHAPVPVQAAGRGTVTLRLHFAQSAHFLASPSLASQVRMPIPSLCASEAM